jgi:hypothetical protein
MGGGKIVKRERETGRRVGGGDERMDVREEVGEREVWLNSGLFLSLSHSGSCKDPFPPPLKTFKCCPLELAPLRTAKDLRPVRWSFT